MRAVVYERDPSFFSRAQGYGLTLQQGSSAIAALGLTADAEAEGSRSTCHVAMNAKGSVIGRHGAAARTPRAPDKDGSSGGDGGGGGTSAAAARRRNLHLPRQSLRALLYARLDRDTVRWNHRFDGCVVEADGRLNLSFNGGKLRTVADVLVGGGAGGGPPAGAFAHARHVRAVAAPALLPGTSANHSVNAACPSDMRANTSPCRSSASASACMAALCGDSRGVTSGESLGEPPGLPAAEDVGVSPVASVAYQKKR